MTDRRARLTLTKLLAGVALLGVLYVPFDRYALQHPPREEVCRSCRNLIDRVVSEWEAQHHVEFTAGPDRLEIDFDAGGRVLSVSSGLRAQAHGHGDLERGDLSIAKCSEDATIFDCPMRYWGQTGRYRWILSKDPVPELGGARRGVWCGIHGGGI